MAGSFYGELIVRITSDTKGLSAGTAKAAAESKALGETVSASAKKAGVNWNRVGLGMQNVGRTMTQFFTIPVAAGFALATYSAVKYEQSLLKVKNLTGTSAEDTRKYGEEILKLAKSTGVGPQKLAEAFYFIASSGFKAAQAMNVLRISAQATMAGLGDTQITADVLTSAMNAYGHSNLTAARATDILMRTIEVGKAEPEALTTSLGRIMPIAAKLGVPLEQLGGMIAGLTLGGLSSAEAVTSLRGTLIALVAPAKMSMDELKKLDLTYKDITNSIRDKGLLATLEMLNQKTGGNMLQMRRIIPNVRALNGVMSLLGANYEKNVKVIAKVTDSQGALDRAVAYTAEQPLQKLKKAWADIQVTFIKVGQTILPTVASLAQKIGDLFAAFDRLPGSVKSTLLWGAAIAATFGPLLMIFGSVIRSLALMKTAFIGVKIAQTGAMGASAGAGAASWLVSAGPWVAAAAGVAALAYGLYRLDTAMHPPIATAKEMKAALDAITADTTGTIEAWSEKNLGGHYVVEKGELVWRPTFYVDIPNVEEMVGDRFRKAAEERRKAAEKALTDLENVTKTRAQEIKDALYELDNTSQAMLRPAPGQSWAAFDEGLKLQRSQLQDELDKILAVKESFFEKWNRLGKEAESDKVMAHIKDIKAAMSSTRAELARFPKTPTTVKMALAETSAKQRLADLRKLLRATVKEDYEIVITARLEKAKSKVSDLVSTLKDLKKGGVTRAELTIFDKTKTALANAKKKVDDLTKKKYVVNFEANTDPALTAAQTLHDQLKTMFQDPLTQVINILEQHRPPPKAYGGFFSRATNVIVGEAGPEVIIPLSKPARAQQLMEQAGLTSSGGTNQPAVSSRTINYVHNGDIIGLEGVADFVRGQFEEDERRAETMAPR